MGWAHRRMRGYWVRGPQRADARQSGGERSVPFWEAFCGGVGAMHAAGGLGAPGELTRP